MPEKSGDRLREAAPAYDDLEARRARAGVAAALFGDLDAGEGEGAPVAERVKVGRYVIDSRLGAGGMGVVYRAHDPDLDRPVAVKLLHTDSSADGKARARMLREARSLAKLSHPNVITVYDVGTDDEQVFVAMELVAGPDLRRWLAASKTRDWREILQVFVAAGRGLEAAHDVALVHRDFKPENVLVGDDGRVRVLDFGLARVRRALEAATDGGDRGEGEAGGLPGPDAAATNEENLAHLPTAAFAGGLTETGALIGTPLYMAPEIYGGKSADARSDQFAFCASLYEGVYGQLPFGCRNLSAHVLAVREGKVVAPPESSEVPAALWRVIARGLEADPEARYPDMSTLLAELEGIAKQAAVAEVEGTGGRTLWWLIPLFVLAAVIGLVGLELGWFGAEEPRPEPVDPVGEEAEEAEPPAVQGEDARTSADETEGRVVPAGGENGPPGENEAETETGQADGETGGAQEEADAEVGEDTSEGGQGGQARQPERSKHGWCHLHEDRYTLISRTSRRKVTLSDDGQCYRCRVESRSSRTRNFSPRDCAGYSLCGPAPASECR